MVAGHAPRRGVAAAEGQQPPREPPPAPAEQEPLGGRLGRTEGVLRARVRVRFARNRPETIEHNPRFGVVPCR